MSGTWSQASINNVIAACIGKYVWDIPTTSSGTVKTYFIYRATTKCSWAFWHTKTVKMMYRDNNGHISLWLTMKFKANNHWHSNDPHFQDGAGSMSLSLFPIMAVNTSFMTVCYLSPARLPKIHDQGSLTLIFKMGQGEYRNLFFI